MNHLNPLLRGALRVSSLIILLSLSVVTVPAESADEEPKSLAVLNHVTGWSLGAAGYHPAVYLLLENVSGRDLSGVTLKIQGKFTDVHTLEPSTAKLEVRRTLKPAQQFRLAVIAPKSYELPREVAYWPVMETKLMLRAGDVGDEGTETLLVTRIDATTETQDDAFQRLNEVTSYKRREHPPHHAARKQPAATARPAESEPVTPLVATAGKIKSVSSQSGGKTVSELFNRKGLPGLGDDFYEFEQAFGMPQITESKKKDFTWARFKDRASDTDVVVCSKDMTGKADLIVLQLPKKKFANEQQLFAQARALAGVMKGQSLGPPKKSVRYLASGRLEITTCQAQGYRMVCLTTPEDGAGEAAYIITLNRMPQETSALLLEQSKDNSALKGFPVLKP
ncbi:MAG: hypothetical protein K2W95_03050 [Candidatus Obscuribacterales bacterium]|nr:hypothetical protein [Candidatus Obscuribacterales bacterium]